METFRQFLNMQIPIFGGGIKVWTLSSIIIGLVSIIVMAYIARKGFKRKKAKDELAQAPLLALCPSEAVVGGDILAITRMTIAEPDNIPEEKGAKLVEVEVTIKGGEVSCEKIIEAPSKKIKRLN